MQVVSNTSPLSALSIIGRLGLLREQFRTIRIPEAVWIELSRLDHVSGKIPSLKFEMDRLVQDAGFFVSDRVRKTFLAEAGESP